MCMHTQQIYQELDSQRMLYRNNCMQFQTNQKSSRSYYNSYLSLLRKYCFTQSNHGYWVWRDHVGVAIQVDMSMRVHPGRCNSVSQANYFLKLGALTAVLWAHEQGDRGHCVLIFQILLMSN